MHSHYDAIIIGDSLAGRIAGTQLTRSGCRVLTLEEGLAISPAWFTSSLQLENLLDQLSGRSCLTTPPTFQVITPSARVEICSRHPLEEVLLREFPEDGHTLFELLTSLQKRGETLEKALFESGRVPLKGLGGELRYRWRALRNGLGLASGKKPFTGLLQSLSLTPAGNEFTQALFTGLSLTPYEQLSITEAALLWSSHAREHGASASGLDTLLRQRYEQFHGQSEPLENLRQIDTTAQQVKQVVLKNGSSCTADAYLIASTGQLPALSPQVNQAGLRLPVPTSRVSTSALQGAPSPLLANRVILSGSPSLRLCFGKRGEETLCAIDIPGGATLPTAEQLQSQLMPVLPFCRYALEMPKDYKHESNKAPQRNRLGQQTSVRLLRNALLCHGAGVFPSLGSSGEVLLGNALAQYVQSRRPKK